MLLNGRRNVGLVIRVGIWYFNIGFVCEIDRNKIVSKRGCNNYWYRRVGKNCKIYLKFEFFLKGRIFRIRIGVLDIKIWYDSLLSCCIFCFYRYN